MYNKLVPAMDCLQKYIEATNTHNFENVSALLSSDAVYYFTDATLTTTEAIRAYFESAWNSLSDETYWASDVVYLHQDETSCTFVYQYNYKGHMNGVLVQGSGRATNVFVLQDGDFKLIHEHLSVEVR